MLKVSSVGKEININLRLGAVGLATAHLTRMDQGALNLWKAMSFDPRDRIKEPMLFFNRLNVPAKYRRQGVARRLLGEVLRFAEGYKYNILNQVSSTNPSFSNHDLVEFYKRYGFEVLDVDLMIYESGKSANITRMYQMVQHDPVLLVK